MLTDHDEEQKRQDEERQQELLRQKEIEAHASTIWSEITAVLLDAIEAFNELSPVHLRQITSASPYTFNIEVANQQNGIVITFFPSTGTISWVCPPSTEMQGTLTVEISSEGHYTIHDPQRPDVEIALQYDSPEDTRPTLDEVILGEFLRTLIKPR
jgi:hypothetical protein